MSKTLYYSIKQRESTKNRDCLGTLYISIKVFK